jgi:hypothetical protein
MLLREWKFLSRRCRRPNMCKEKAAIYRRGWSLYLKEKKLVYCHNYAGKPTTTTTNYIRSRTDVYLLELRRRSDSSLRRRLGQKNLVQVAYRPALYIYIYKRQKSGRRRRRNTPRTIHSLPILCRRESFDVVGCVTLDLTCNKRRVRT